MTIWIFLAVVLLCLAWVIYLLQKILNNTQNHGLDLCMFRGETFALNEATKKRDYNARHRDERLLRELHKIPVQITGLYDFCIDRLDNLETGIKGIIKQLRTLENVQGKCKNDGVEVKDGVLQIRKNLTASGKILAELQGILDKAKKRS